MSNPTLVYFDAQGRGESIRLAFAAGKCQYTDRRVAYDKWAEEQKAAPQGRVPYLELGGEKPSQSLAILRYVGRKGGLCSNDDLEQLFIDELIDTCQDLFEAWVISMSNGPTDEKAINKFKTEDVPKYFSMLEALVKAHGRDGFACGNKLTIADCMLYNTLEHAGTETLSKYPCLKKNMEKVRTQPGIAEYLQKRVKKQY